MYYKRRRDLARNVDTTKSIYSRPDCICGHRAVDHKPDRVWPSTDLYRCLICPLHRSSLTHQLVGCFRYRPSDKKPKQNRFHKSKMSARKRVNQRLARRG